VILDVLLMYVKTNDCWASKVCEMQGRAGGFPVVDLLNWPDLGAQLSSSETSRIMGQNSGQKQKKSYTSSVGRSKKEGAALAGSGFGFGLERSSRQLQKLGSAELLTRPILGVMQG
jgi:hypothetical protein